MCLRKFCKLVLDRDNIIRSSAYKRELNFVSFGKTIGSDKIFSNTNGRSLMYRLKNNRLKIQPWRTPLEQGNERVLSEFDRFMAHDEVEHKLFIM